MTLRFRHRLHHGSHAALSNARATWTARGSVLLELTDGVITGTGEASPLPGHSAESLEDVVSELERLRLDPNAELAPELGGAAAWLAALEGLPRTASARFAVETALLDYWGRRLGLPLWRLLTREPVEDVLSPSVVVDPLAEDLEQRVERALAEGIRTIKLKVGVRPLEERESIARLRRRFSRDELRVRVDANRVWSAAEVARNLAPFAELDVELVEEPSYEAWPEPERRTLPWALDESLRDVVPAKDWLEARSPAAVVLKPMLLGGFSRCLAWADAARKAGVPVLVSHFFDGPIALAATTQLAFAVQSVELAAGLGPHAALQAWEGTCDPPRFVTPRSLTLPRASGHGVVPASLRARDDASLSVSAAARERPDQVALSLDERDVTFAELASLAEARLAVLEASGAAEASRRSGRPIALCARPTLEALSWLYACLDARLPVLPLHPRLGEAERAELVARVHPAALVEGAAGPISLRPGGALVTSGDDQEADLAWLMTSGSTGTPKAVRLSRRAFLASARASEENLGWLERDRWLLGIPWAHVGGLSVVVRCLVARRTVVLDRKLDADAWSRFLEEHGVTLLSLVPTQLTRLLDAPSFTFPPRARAVLLGGAPATPSLLRAATERGVPVLPTYGLTETCAQIATARYEDAKRGDRAPLGAVGPALCGIELRVEASGAIAVRGPTLLSGYADEASPLSDDGWLTTSDWGELTPQGLRVHGRLDNVILTGGENVSAEAVEALLLEHPDVENACVVGVPDAEWGELVTAVVQLRARDAGKAKLATLAAWAKEHLSSVVRPKRWLERSELPLLPSGKLDRAAIARDARGAQP